jgi:hypothetical protein
MFNFCSISFRFLLFSFFHSRIFSRERRKATDLFFWNKVTKYYKRRSEMMIPNVTQKCDINNCRLLNTAPGNGNVQQPNEGFFEF